MAQDGVTCFRYEYDAANRLKYVRRDSDGVELQQFGHGSTNARFQSLDSQTGVWTMYASVGGTVLAEYTITVPAWTKRYTYLGDSQLATALLVGFIFAIPFLFIKKKKHWMTVRTENAFAVIKLGDRNYRQIVSEFETRGVKVADLKEEGK